MIPNIGVLHVLCLPEILKAGGFLESNLREIAIVIELASKSVAEQAIYGGLFLRPDRGVDFFDGLEEGCGF